MSKDLEVSKRIKYLLVSSRNVNEADSLLNDTVSDWEGMGFARKMEFLKKNFKFRMCTRFTLEEEEERKAREDYYATMQYLISEAKDFGLESVVRV